jgi:phosphatidylglycerol lysyltransferase
MSPKVKRLILNGLGLALFSVALWLLHHLLQEYHYHDIRDSLKAIPGGRVGLAFLLTAVGYLTMTGYDVLALRFIGHRLPYRRTAMGSFVSYIFSNNLGLAILGATAMRYRLYSSWGLKASEIAKMVAFVALTFWLGTCLTGGIVFVTAPAEWPEQVARFVRFRTSLPVGVFMLALVAGYAVLILFRRRPINIRGWEFPIPTVGGSAVQIALAAADLAFAASVLYVLLPSPVPLSYFKFLGLFMIAMISTMILHAPAGGLGVFEAIILVLMKPYLAASGDGAATGLSEHDVVVAMIAWRIIYFFIPLLVGLALLGYHEVRERRDFMRRAIEPEALGMAVFMAGVMLIISSAIPEDHARLHWLRGYLPFGVIEFAHIAAAAAGAGLLILGRGVTQRLAAAHTWSITLLVIGVVCALVRGLDVEESAVCFLIFTVVLASRRHFYRRASVFDEYFSSTRIISILVALGAALWMGLFIYKRIDLKFDLLFHFDFNYDHAGRLEVRTDNAARSLRAAVAIAVSILGFVAVKALRAPPPAPETPSEPVIDDAAAIAAGSISARANLVRSGDKDILFNRGRSAFIMFARRGRSLIAFGDPVGPENERVELLWQFDRCSTRAEGLTVFFQTGPGLIPKYEDMGLIASRIGETAIVPLAGFSLDGDARAGLRETCERFQRDHFAFEVVALDGVAPRLPTLTGVSDAWRAQGDRRDRRFAHGFFNETYLRRFPMAIVRCEGSVVAFANILRTVARRELAVDLIRHLPDAPTGVVDYIVAQTALWACSEGYGAMDMGLTPAGASSPENGPAVEGLDPAVYALSEHFPDLAALRRFKESFGPAWEPRYMAAPGGRLLEVVMDVNALIIGARPKASR